jgi:tape measure domain-containing protein
MVRMVVKVDGEDAGAQSVFKNLEESFARFDDSLSKAGKRISESLGEVGKNTEKITEQAKPLGDRFNEAFSQMSAGSKQLTESLAQAKTALLAFVGVKWAAGQVKNLIDLADAYGQMTSRIKIATKETGDYSEVTNELQRISQLTYKRFTDNAEIYVRTEKTMRELGFATTDVMGVVEGLSTSLVISGANAQQTESAISAFSKAMQLGKIGMKEFTSLAASSPRILDALADGLGVTGVELRKMAAAGQLTSDKVIPALNSQLGLLREETKKMPVSVSDAMTKLGNAMLFVVGKTDEATGATKAITVVMGVLADNIGKVMAVLTALGTLILATLARMALPYLITAFKALVATAVSGGALVKASWEGVVVTLAKVRAATTGVSLALKALGKATILLAVFTTVYEVVSLLAEKFAIVRVAGVAMIQALMTGIEDLQYKWELFKALFTSDTFTAATERHQQRLAAMSATFKDMYADAWGEAADATKKAGDAVQTVEQKLEQLKNGAITTLGAAFDPLKTALEGVNKELSAVEKTAQDANAAINTAMSGISSAYQGIGGLAEQQAKDELAAITERYNGELAELNRVQEHKGILIQKSAQLFKEMVDAEVALAKSSSDERLRLIDEEGRHRLEVAARHGDTDAERKENVKRVENEILKEKKNALQTALETYRKHINDLNAEEQRHLDAVKRIEREKQMLKMSTDDAIRELQRSTMSDYEAYQDKQTQIAELQAKSRSALASGEYDSAQDYAKKAMDLARQSAGAVKDGDREIITSKQAVNTAIISMRASEDLLLKALSAEQAAHKSAADSAADARKTVEKTFSETQRDVDNLSGKLADGFSATINIDTSALDEALKKLDEATAQKEILLPIKADLEEAQKEIEAMKYALETGGVKVNVDTEKAREALAGLKTYAEETGNIELKVATKEADAAIKNVSDKLKELSKVETESKHKVKDNVEEVKKEIDSLNGRDTSSVHTQYLKTVETAASGGLIGRRRLARFADGGFVGFPSMAGGTVPGSGDGDTVPRTLDAGSFVLRKAAVQKYKEALLEKLAVARFALGGLAIGGSSGGGGSISRGSSGGGSRFGIGTKDEKTVDASASDEDKEVFDKLGKINDAAGRLPKQRGFVNIGDWAHYMASVFWGRSKSERQQIAALVNENYHRWMYRIKEALQARPPHGIAAGLDMLEYAYAKGGEATSGTDTVPAMLTPGEFVVNRDAVKRIGVGFLEALNAMKVPAKALADRFQHFSLGGFVDGGASLARSMMPAYSTPAFAGAETSTAPTRTVRLELSVGGRTINASIPESEEAKLLAAIESSRRRAV